MTTNLIKRFDSLIDVMPRGGWIVLSVLLAMAIIWTGLRPALDLPRISRLPPGSDKVLHFLSYAALAACIFRGIFPRNARKPPLPIPLPWFPVILVPALVGMLDEFLQSYTRRGRSGDMNDWLADILGGIFVCAVGLILRELAKGRVTD